MTAIDKILVVIDPTATSQPALERIAHLPRPLTAQLMLLICDYEPYLGIGDALAPEAVAAARASVLVRHRKRLEELAAPLDAQGLDVLVDVRWDYPLHEAIIRKAVEWGADLVVKDTHHHSVLRRSIFSNTDWNLIRHCPTQLLLVKPRAIGHVPCVVAAVDPLHPRDKAASLDDRILTVGEGARAPVGRANPRAPLVRYDAGHPGLRGRHDDADRAADGRDDRRDGEEPHGGRARACRQARHPARARSRSSGAYARRCSCRAPTGCARTCW